MPWNTDWTGVPHTDAKAQVVLGKEVTNAHVVWVEQASIRNATVRNVHFLVANPESVGRLFRGRPSAEVQCLWYGRKAPTTWMHLILTGRYDEKRRYTGLVATDFRRPE